MIRSIAAVALTVFFLGCATTKIDWNTRIGQYSYDEAIRELGVPDRQAQLTDGSIVAEWLMRRGGAYGHSHYFGRRFHHTYDITEMPDRYLRLAFGPDMQLNSSSYFSR